MNTVKKCNIILDIERNKLHPDIRGPGSFICKVGVQSTKEFLLDLMFNLALPALRTNPPYASASHDGSSVEPSRLLTYFFSVFPL